MFRYLALFLVCASLAQAAPVLPKDKQAHLATGALLGFGVAAIAEKRGAKHPWLWGLGAGLLAGTAKELYDRRHPERHSAELGDALATSRGAALGAFISIRIRW